MAVSMTERPYEVAFSKNPVVYRFQTDTDLTTAGLRIDVRLFFREFNTASFVQQFELPLVPDSAGLASIDVSKTLDSLVEYELPTISNATAEQAFLQAGQFYVDYREVTTAAPDPAWSSDLGDTRVVIKGGLPHQHWQGSNYFINYNGVLTWQKTGRYIGPTEKTWLTYLHLGTNNQENMSAKINVYYTDGTSSLNAVTIALDESVPKYGIYRIPVGAQLALKDLDDTKVINYYTVRIVAATTNLTVEFKYIVDWRNNYSKTTLYFFNSLGGYDSLRLLGELGKKTAYERSYAEKTLGDKYYSTTEVANMQENIRNQEQELYSGSVGLMDDPDHYDRIRDMMVSTRVMQIKFSRWWPVLITNNTIDHGNDGDSIKDFPVDFTPGYVNESYAPDIRIGDLPACPVITNLDADFGLISWDGDAAHVQYVIERWDALQTSVAEVVYTASTSYEFTEFGLIGFVRVKAVCGYSETPFSDFIYLMV
jgi:hypothetical protein